MTQKLQCYKKSLWEDWKRIGTVVAIVAFVTMAIVDVIAGVYYLFLHVGPGLVPFAIAFTSVMNAIGKTIVDGYTADNVYIIAGLLCLALTAFRTSQAGNEEFVKEKVGVFIASGEERHGRS